jgi:nucleoside 2-deoxyribosyltransferase/sugar/nucleoside kinase (ribokinase family)
MNQNPKFCLIGEVIVDVTLTSPVQQNKMRLGGIFHAARTLWAMGVSYDLLYIAPDYLSDQIEVYAIAHGAASTTHVGTVKGSPNVILINDPTEAGDQGYELLLRDAYQCIFDSDKLDAHLTKGDITDIVIFPGGFDLPFVLTACQQTRAKVHIDIANAVADVDELTALGKKYDTIILSTSSKLFLDMYNKSVTLVRDVLLGPLCNNFLFKENRGGARFFQESDPDTPIQVDAQVRSIVHSVGVGDCFNVVFCALSHKFSQKAALTYASWIAAEYAFTTYPDDFKRECQRVLTIPADQIVLTPGVSLPWDVRPAVQIYVAAPDFDFIDTTAIKRLVDSLRYHNFTPRLPIQENGQMGVNATKERRQALFQADMKLLSVCQLVVAVLIGNDPGTLIEIGLAAGLKKPVIVYDPYNKAENLMLTELPQLVSPNLDEVIAQVFVIAARIAS